MSELLEKTIYRVEESHDAFCRYITANDTGSNGSHQAGFYIPKCAAGLLFDTPGVKGENKHRNVQIKWQDDFTTNSRFIYYGRGTRNEYRITCFGKDFPFFEEDNVGDLLIIIHSGGECYEGYVLSSDEDIDGFLAAFNLSPDMTNQLIDTRKARSQETSLEKEIRALTAGSEDFPDTLSLAALARSVYGKVHRVTDSILLRNPDKVLLEWIDTEFRLFRGFEEKIYAPVYRSPFANCQELIKFSNSILNRRKSRAGKSLEHHLSNIFTTARLEFEEQAVTEDNKKPDFLFPGGKAYHDFLFPAGKLVFLGAKTTCKDRWRQVLNEADRIKTKYLFTLQQGISKNQLREMKHERLKLVVPAPYVNSFDKEYRAEISTLASFIAMVRETQADDRRMVITRSID